MIGDRDVGELEARLAVGGKEVHSVRRIVTHEFSLTEQAHDGVDAHRPHPGHIFADHERDLPVIRPTGTAAPCQRTGLYPFDFIFHKLIRVGTPD